MPQFDQRSFRSALGRFATGVTVVTARGANGRPVGVTANSFNSVSLNPPLVLWSLDRTSSSLDAFETSDEFAIHILAIDQEHISNRFASRTTEKFDGMDIGFVGVPLLDGCAARFHCRKEQRHEVGDHILYIGEVIDFSARDHAPLLYLHGKYGEARRRETAELGYDVEAARLGDGAILNLLSRAYVRVLAEVRIEFEKLGLQQPAPIVLAALAEGITKIADIEKFVEDREHVFSNDERDDMVGQALITIEGDEVQVLPKGKEVYTALVTALKDVEERLVKDFTSGELSEARHFLSTFAGHRER
jgi:3-hydroxy-9,10-secoandrosta-1,3,5(10)-triene-9,17-dione monooxygenase reductase component